jgi:hypothetical protein
MICSTMNYAMNNDLGIMILKYLSILFLAFLAAVYDVTDDENELHVLFDQLMT